MLKKLAFLGIFSAISALSANSAAQAAILWDWSFNGTESVRFTTDGDIADLGSANTFNITDFEVLASIEAPLVGADFINDPSTITQGAQGFQWDGSQITQVFRQGGTFINGANFFLDDIRYTFSVNYSELVDESDFDPGFFVSAFNPTPSAPPLGTVPEPLTLLGAGAAVAFGSAFKRKLNQKGKKENIKA